MKQIILGTAGHIDHGKTTLIKALTGIDTDRLKEEKERGITIDLGFAHLETESGTLVGIVDVPGHERFVRNMLAGAGGIDMVLVVVAADEGVMPQTREHLSICSLLQVKRGLVALTKTDLVDEEWLELVKEDVQSYLKGGFLEGAPTFPVSSRTGEGLTQLRSALEEMALQVEPKNVDGVFRMPIDRAFTMRGFGTVVTGTIFSGKVKQDDRVEIYPGGHRSRVRGLQVHNQSVPEAAAGQRTAINLPGIEKVTIERGDVISWPETLKVTTRIDATFHLLPEAGRTLRNRTRIRFHLGTAEIMGRMILLEGDELAPGDKTFVQIVLEEPVVALVGDPYVVRSFSPIFTIGGGEILDITPGRHKRRDVSVLETLGAKDRASGMELLKIYLKESGFAGLSLKDVVFLMNTGESQARELILQLVSTGEAVEIDKDTGWVLHSENFKKARQDIMMCLESFHQEFPLKPGISKEELRSRFASMGERVFLNTLNALGDALRIEGNRVKLASHRIRLGVKEKKIVEELEREYLQAGFHPPSFEEACRKIGTENQNAKELLQVLLDDGRLIRIKDNVLFHTENLRRAEDILVEHLRADHQVTAAQFRDMLDVSRKFAIPLLEHFDAKGITVRTGDVRVLRQQR